jgi:hypothetical protein
MIPVDAGNALSMLGGRCGWRRRSRPSMRATMSAMGEHLSRSWCGAGLQYLPFSSWLETGRTARFQRLLVGDGRGRPVEFG